VGFLIVAALLASHSAQTPSVRDPEAQAVLRLEDEWAVGLTRRDVGVFRRLLAQGFVYTEDDRTVGRDDVLHDIAAGSDTVQAARNEDMQVHRFGATAIVTGWLVVSGRGPGGPFHRRYRFTDTWVRRGGGGGGGGGGWQIVAAQDYLVPTR
jgi:ketosteroid isomerase-like protein